MEIGVIGGGSAAKAHLNALDALDSVDQVLLFARNIEKATKLADDFKKVKVGDSLQELALSSDAVVIATPNHTHLDLLKKIYKYKRLPVLSEKPLACSVEEANEFMELADPLSIVGFNYRFNQPLMIMLELQKKHDMGNVTHINLSFKGSSGLTKKTTGWKDSNNQQGTGGACGDIGIHLMDLIGFISDSVINQSKLHVSLGQRVPNRGDVELSQEDCCVLSGLTLNDVPFKLEASKTCEPNEAGLFLEINFSRGKAVYFSQTPNVVKLISFSSPGVEEIVLDAPLLVDPGKEISYWSDSFYGQMKCWVESLKNKKLNQELATIKAGVSAQRILECCFRLASK